MAQAQLQLLENFIIEQCRRDEHLASRGRIKSLSMSIYHAGSAIAFDQVLNLRCTPYKVSCLLFSLGCELEFLPKPLSFI